MRTAAERDRPAEPDRIAGWQEQQLNADIDANQAEMKQLSAQGEETKRQAASWRPGKLLTEAAQESMILAHKLGATGYFAASLAERRRATLDRSQSHAQGRGLCS